MHTSLNNNWPNLLFLAQLVQRRHIRTSNTRGSLFNNNNNRQLNYKLQGIAIMIKAWLNHHRLKMRFLTMLLWFIKSHCAIWIPFQRSIHLIQLEVIWVTQISLNLIKVLVKLERRIFFTRFWKLTIIYCRQWMYYSRSLHVTTLDQHPTLIHLTALLEQINWETILFQAEKTARN